MDPLVERSIDLAADTDDVWRAITDADELAGWFAPAVALDPVPGGDGRFVDDDGIARAAVVEEVDPGRRLAFRWWPEEGGDGAGASVVTFTVVPRPGGSRLLVTERLVATATATATASASGSAVDGVGVGDAWLWRFDLLWLRLQAVVRV